MNTRLKIRDTRGNKRRHVPKLGSPNQNLIFYRTLQDGYKPHNH